MHLDPECVKVFFFLVYSRDPREDYGTSNFPDPYSTEFEVYFHMVESR